MSKPDELADALWVKKPVRKDPLGRNGYPDAVFVSKAELRTLARAAAKAAWEEGYVDGFEDGEAGPEPYAVNPYTTESYE